MHHKKFCFDVEDLGVFSATTAKKLTLVTAVYSVLIFDFQQLTPSYPDFKPHKGTLIARDRLEAIEWISTDFLRFLGYINFLSPRHTEVSGGSHEADMLQVL